MYREANHCADILARMRCEHEVGLVIYEQASIQLEYALLSDIVGVSTPLNVVVILLALGPFFYQN